MKMSKNSKLIPFPQEPDKEENMGMFPYAVNPSFVQRYRNPVVAQKTSDDDLWYHLITDCGLGVQDIEGINYEMPGVAQKLHYFIPHTCPNNAKKL